MMRPLLHLRKSSDIYLRGHPFHSLLLFLVTFLLAVLAALILAVPAK